MRLMFQSENGYRNFARNIDKFLPDNAASNSGRRQTSVVTVRTVNVTRVAAVWFCTQVFVGLVYLPAFWH